MLFNSLQFLVFFAFIVTHYYAIPSQRRWLLLLAASCYFYMVFVPVYILILFAVILIDYFAAFLIARNTGALRKLFLGLSLVTNIGILCYFKYYNFFLENVTLLLSSWHIKNPLPFIEVVLPVGLSFHTFQAMSYTIEVYRGRQAPEKHLGIYALYVLFFPQLVAGPIERPQNLLHQFHATQVFSKENLRRGLLLMAWGFFKKMVIADRLAQVVDYCYTNAWWESTGGMWIGVIFYSIQIYCDFSGYSDIAVGSAKTLGVDLMENFRNPYLSTSMTEFWRRWHISLSTWFRDYIYIPLGGSRVPLKKYIAIVLLVFIISGLWHGAKYTFLIWGLLHGLLLLLEHFTHREDDRMNLFQKAFRTLYVFFASTIAWVFFRAQSIQDALFVLRKLFFPSAGSSYWLPVGTNEMFFIVVLITILLGFEKKIKTFDIAIGKKYYASLWMLIVVIYVFGIYNYRQFIYFQF
jgi:D-alanyl-lipoteichoic acid acyltransferase DltB (MBOAT superfamily)